jgi:glycosyltransferase involved in cell wall biosynthesis
VLRVVFVGSLLPQKGVHTAIEAMGLLSQTHPTLPVSLDILGAGHPDYEDRLHRMVAEFSLADRVTFHKPIPRSQLPAFLAEYDALVLPSIWEEPMALISQEAMAAGLVLIGTLTGGTKEILVEGENGLTFPPEGSRALAAQIQRLMEDSALRHNLSEAGQATAEARFALERTLSELESSWTQTST